MGNLAVTLGKEVLSFAKSGEKVVASKPIQKNLLKFSKPEKLTSLKTREYSDVISDMTAQRSGMVNTVEPEISVEQMLAHWKDNYIGANREIRQKIMSDLGDENACYFESIIKEELPKIDKLISQSCLPRSVTLYRGASPYDFGLADLSSKDFIQKFYKKGKVFEIPVYPEVSLDKTIGEKFASNRILFKYNCPEGLSGIYMENLGDLSSVAKDINEQEVLLPRNLIAKFKSHTQKDGKDIIEIDILNKKTLFKKVHKFWKEV